MNRGLIIAIVLAFPVLWAWGSHGLVWDVPPKTLRLGCTPGRGTEALAFAKSQGALFGVELIDLVAPRQVLRGITSDSLDGGVISVEDAILSSSGGEDIVIVGLLGPTGNALASRVLVTSAAGSSSPSGDLAGPFQRAVADAQELAASQEEGFRAFALRRGNPAPGQGPGFGQYEDVRSQVVDVNDVLTRGIVALRTKNIPVSDAVLAYLTRGISRP